MSIQVELATDTPVCGNVLSTDAATDSCDDGILHRLLQRVMSSKTTTL